MPADRRVANSGAYNFDAGQAMVNGKPRLVLFVHLPVCLAVDQNWQPVLSSADDCSHLSYGVTRSGK